MRRGPFIVLQSILSDLDMARIERKWEKEIHRKILLRTLTEDFIQYSFKLDFPKRRPVLIGPGLVNLW